MERALSLQKKIGKKTLQIKIEDKKPQLYQEILPCGQGLSCNFKDLYLCIVVAMES